MVHDLDGTADDVTFTLGYSANGNLTDDGGDWN